MVTGAKYVDVSWFNIDPNRQKPFQIANLQQEAQNNHFDLNEN
jgi:hypothetical protein